MDIGSLRQKNTYIETIVLLVVLAVLISLGSIFQTNTVLFADYNHIGLVADGIEDSHVTNDGGCFLSYEDNDNGHTGDSSDGLQSIQSHQMERSAHVLFCLIRILGLMSMHSSNA